MLCCSKYLGNEDKQGLLNIFSYITLCFINFGSGIMKKLLLIALIFSTAFGSLAAQMLVGTAPEKKNAILEEFTGVRCGYCPDGHARAQAILDAYPNDAFVTAYHPSNGSYNTPYDDDEDLRRDWPSNFWQAQYIGSLGMPNAAVNRRKWSGGVWGTNRGYWMTYCQQIMQEDSPVNVGFRGSYNASTKTLTVDVEAYYTANVTSEHSINVVLSQNGIVTQQASAGSDYHHKHTFREGLTTAKWGDPINEATTQGSLIKRQYTFKNTKNYPMEDCEIIVFIRDKANEEVVTGMGGPAMSPSARMAVSGETDFVLVSTQDATKEVTLTNLTDKSLQMRLKAEKSARTPADWTVELTDGGVVTIEAGASVTATVKFTVGATIGIGDVIITAENMTDPGQADITAHITAIHKNIKGVQVVDNDGGYTVTDGIADAELEYAFGDITTDQMDMLLYANARPRVVVWNSGEESIPTTQKLSKINSMISENINVMMVGTAFPFALNQYSQALLSTLGITVGDALTDGNDLSEFMIRGVMNDPITHGFNENAKLIKYNLTEINIGDDDKASAILNTAASFKAIATKHQMENSRVVMLGLNPAIFIDTKGRDKLIKKAVEWLDAGSPTGPKLTTVTTSIDFGEVNNGEDLNIYVDIANEGSDDLEITATNLSGDEVFAITEGGVDGANIVVAPGEEHSIKVTFTPNAEASNYSGQLTILSNDAEKGELIIPLSGSSAGSSGTPNLDFGIVKLNYGEVPSGSNLDLELTLENSGTADLKINDLSITGDAKDFFTIESGDGNLPATVTAGSTMPVVIKFTPEADLTEDKTYKAVLLVETGAVDSKNYELDLEGIGKAQTAVFEDGSVTNGLMTLWAGPNPFSSESTIKLNLNKASDYVILKVLDANGREVAELINGNLGAGEHVAHFNGADLSSGKYYIQAVSNNRTITLSVVIVK